MDHSHDNKESKKALFIIVGSALLVGFTLLYFAVQSKQHYRELNKEKARQEREAK